MRSLEEIKEILQRHKEEIKERYKVEIIGIFGSYARGEEEETSDVDVLVEFIEPIGLKFFELWDYLENILGIEVDLLTLNALQQKSLLWESVKNLLMWISL